jgi:serine protease Do
VAIQTDAGVSAMNYGGPLVDLRGRVVAMIASVLPTSGSSERAEAFSDSGIGFAIPIADILSELPELQKGGRLEVPFLGIRLNVGRLKPGAEVLEVLAATAAAESGIKDGDVITEFDGHQILSPFQLLYQIGSHRVGDQVTFKVRRGQETLTLSGKLKALPDYLSQ